MTITTVAKNEVENPKTTPKLGFFVYYLAFMAVIGGFLFGYDTGIVSCAMLYIPNNRAMAPVNNLWQGLIVSLTPGAAAVGALLAGPVSDRMGRRLVIIAASLLFAIGAIVCGVAMTKVVLIIGRIFLGFAIGFASMVVPVYVSEASPYYLRGALTTCFQLMITFGLFASDILAGVFSYWDPENIGWRLMLGCAMIPAVVQFVGFFFLPESPRYLYFVGEHEKSRQVLQKIYANSEEWVNFVLTQLSVSYEQEKRSKEQVGDQIVLIRILRTPHVLKALCIGCALQAFQQLSGVNTIMYYTATIVKSAGVKDSRQSIWISGAVAAVNFLGTFVPLATVEKFGRRPLLLLSIAGVILSLTMMGVSFLLIHNDSASSQRYALNEMYSGQNTTDILHGYNRCEPLRNCDACTTNEHCGFCHFSTETKSGYCFPKPIEKPTVSKFGYCKEGHNDSFVFEDDFCQTKFTVMPIIFMITYLLFFSIVIILLMNIQGYAPLCWVMNSEFYPLWARSTGCALSTFSNWAFNLLVSLTFLTLSEAVTRFGAFFVYDGLSIIAFIFVFFLVPETKGVTMEEVEKLFMSKRVQKQIVKNTTAMEDILKRTEKVDGVMNRGFVDRTNGEIAITNTEM